MPSPLAASALFDVSQKHALVTGGGRGIGLMIAAGLVQSGANVYIVSRDSRATSEAAASLSAQGPGSCVALPSADLSTDEGCRAVIDALKQHQLFQGKLHILVNNSGTSWGEPFESYPDKAWDRNFHLNVRAVFNLVRAALPLLQACATKDDPSRVINVGSIAGIVPQAWPTYAYDTAKAAVHHLTTKLASEFCEKCITVNAIAPGLVPSKMSEQLRSYASDDALVPPLQRFGAAGDMAGAVIYLSSRAGSWVTGTTLVVDGGALAGRNSLSAKL